MLFIGCCIFGLAYIYLMTRASLLLRPFGNHLSHIHSLSLSVFVCLSRDQDNTIIRPLPKVKRLISDNTCLPHIVQVCSLL